MNMAYTHTQKTNYVAGHPKKMTKIEKPYMNILDLLCSALLPAHDQKHLDTDDSE